MSLKISSENMVPTEAIRELTHGSFEHLSLRLDDAISENAGLFYGDKKSSVARIATFKEHVIVGTADGRYFAAPYRDDFGTISFAMPEALDIPVVNSSNMTSYVSESLNEMVDALMTGKKEDVKAGILSLLNLKESIDDNAKDLATLVYDIIGNDSDWKTAYREHRDTIVNQLGKSIEKIAESHIDSKYIPLYDGSIEESKFHLYLQPAKNDLTTVASRLESLENRIDNSYLPFVEKVGKEADFTKEDKETVDQFVQFGGGLSEEVHDLREHVKIAIENEQCAMCLGQIHDAIAEALSDYEIAGAFVEHMATQYLA